MERARTIAVLALGGAVWGILIGILAGAVCGGLYGSVRGDVSLGLDGALLGGPALGLCGLVYGLRFAYRETQHHRAGLEDVERQPQAGIR